MKIYYVQEICKGFEKQYPEKAKDYLKLFKGKLNFESRIEVYDDIIEFFPQILNIISELEEENK